MTNLEWIRTLSAKELSDLLYDYWLPRGQYVWTDSRKGLIKVLGEKYLERDCDKCKHQVNCYCVKGLGCPFEPKDEPQTETEIAKAIVHKMIDDAVIAEDAYPDLRQKMHDAVDEYEPQTEDEILREQCRAFMGIVEQTGRSE